jgi:hypothetical protein
VGGLAYQFRSMCLASTHLGIGDRGPDQRPAIVTCKMDMSMKDGDAALKEACVLANYSPLPSEGLQNRISGTHSQLHCHPPFVGSFLVSM